MTEGACLWANTQSIAENQWVRNPFPQLSIFIGQQYKFYEVALDKSGRTLIGVDKHFESIAYNNQEDNFRVKKNGREFVCDKKGVEIKAN